MFSAGDCCIEGTSNVKQWIVKMFVQCRWFTQSSGNKVLSGFLIND